MLNKIPIYGPTREDALALAAQMNLSLRQWEYAGPDYLNEVWANVGDVLDRIDTTEGSR